MKDLDEILSGSEPAQAQETIAETPAIETSIETQTEGQPRAADGKFAPKAAPDAVAQQAVEGTEQQPERANVVPQQALHASREKERSERERADRLEREMAELRGFVQAQTQQRQPAPTAEPPKPVEFWDDPAKWGETLLTPVQEQLLETRFMVSEARALAAFGQDAVTAAQTAVKEAIQSGQLNGGTVQAQLRQSRDPIGDVVRWHQNSPAVQEKSMREKLRAEIMAEYGLAPGTAEPAAPAAPAATPSVMPSNLAGARNVGTRAGPAWSGPKPLNDIFDRRKTG